MRASSSTCCCIRCSCWPCGDRSVPAGGRCGAPCRSSCCARSASRCWPSRRWRWERACWAKGSTSIRTHPDTAGPDSSPDRKSPPGSRAPPTSWTYGFGLALVTGFAFYQRLRDSQLRSAALERALTQAHLAALRMQLSPHTLFNLLHTIRGQISWDPPAAQAMVVQLGDLLRRLLSAGEREFSRLSDELQFVALYLELQQKRFADRLTITAPAREDIPRTWVPSLILQPLVENAVLHGLAGHEGAVTIRVEASVSDETLTLRVLNTIAPGRGGSGDTGIGLANVRERLAVQFGERATFEAGPTDEHVWRAQIQMPLLRDGPEGAARPDVGAAL